MVQLESRQEIEWRGFAAMVHPRLDRNRCGPRLADTKLERRHETADTRVAVFGIVCERGREHLFEILWVGHTLDRPDPLRHLVACACGAAPSEQLVHDGSKCEPIGSGAPSTARNHLWRAVWPPNRPGQPDFFERCDYPESGYPGLIGCHKDVPQVERAVNDPSFVGRICGGGQLPYEGHGGVDRGGRIVADRHIQRFRGDILLCQIRHVILETDSEGGHDPWMTDIRRDQPLERLNECPSLLRRDVEVKRFDRHEAVF